MPHSVAQDLAKLNWTCDSCGMSAGRKTSIDRHIKNPNIHGGDGRAVPYGTNRSSSENRTRFIRRPPQVRSSPNNGTGDIRIRIQKEVENLMIQAVAKRIFDSLHKDDPDFKNLEILARGYIIDKSSKGLLRELAKFSDGV